MEGFIKLGSILPVFCIIMQLYSPIVSGQDVSQEGISNLKQYYVVGAHVNVRSNPKINSSVLFQTNWGEAFQVAGTSNNWCKVLSPDESHFFYIHSDYLALEEEFVRRAEFKDSKTGNTYYELINFYERSNEEEKLESLLKEVLIKNIDPISIGFESCLSMGYYAYTKLAFRYKGNLEKLISIGQLNIGNDFLDVWLKLDIIKYYIQHNDLNQSQIIIKELLEINPNNYFLVTGCEYDANFRGIPKRRLLDFCYIVYSLAGIDEQLLFLSDLMKIKEQTNFDLTKEIIEEILKMLRY